ncbi:MAG: DUF5686 and carboxypeptidase regulatory-like domain-containing protein [Breznakibacter sp.]
MIYLHPSLKKLFTALTTCILSFGTLWGQTISGTVTDNAQSPVPYASILVKETSTGTTSNANGEFELSLPSAGLYHVTFQSLGFEKQEIAIPVGHSAPQPLRIELAPQSYNLSEVRIYSSKEDPAYPIMRKAIALAPYHKKQVLDFTSEVYIKASFIARKIPAFIRKRMEVNGQKIEEGQCYTAESINKISFEQPDKYTHTVVSSRSSLPPADEGNDPMGYINASLYDAQIGKIITPLSPNAFSHYQFRYEGFFDDGPLTVNKIKVVPKRKSQQLLGGYLYIIEGLWCIHSVDLTNHAFWGDIRIRQVYTPVRDGIWMPATHHFDLEVSIMGTKADATYAGSVRYLTVTPDNNLKAPAWVKKPEEPALADPAPAGQPSKAQKKLETVMAKENPTNRDMATIIRLMEKEKKSSATKDTSMEIVDNYRFAPKQDTAQRDTAYWNAIRPIPLTADELASYQKADSTKLASVANTPDTAKQKSKSFFGKHVSPVLFGHHWTAPQSRAKFGWKGFAGPSNVGFNPVDGWTYSLKGSVQPRIDSLRSLKLSPGVGYAIARDRWLGQLDVAFSYSPVRRGTFSGSIGRQTTDYNRDNRPTGLVHMGYNLLLKESFRSFFERTYIDVSNGIDLANGLRLTVEANYQRMSPLDNHTGFSFYKRHTPYRPNTPVNPLAGPANMAHQNQFTYGSTIEYTPKYYYRIVKGQKTMVRTDWPTFGLTWQQGIPNLFGSDARWMQLEATIKQQKAVGLSSIDYMVNGGGFLQRDRMHFSAFKAFATFDTDIEFKPMSHAFALLPNYRFHTNRQYIQGHLAYSTPFLALKYLPFFSNRLWNENLYLRHLTVHGRNSHTEIGYGLSRIFLLGEASVVAAFENEKYHSWGVKLTWSF